MQGCGLRGRKEWRQSQSEEEVLELGFDEKQRERPQRLSSWAVPSSALGFRKLSLAAGTDWPGSQETRDEDVAAVVQARMVRLPSGWQTGAIGKVLAEQSPRAGNEGHIQTWPRFQAQEQSRGEWHGE